MVTTVTERQAGYTQRGLQQAKLARRIQDIIMRPPARRFMEIVSKNQFRNCPVDRRHIQAAEDIFGTNVGALRGKTPRRTVGHVTGQHDPVPPDILDAHGDITIAVDIMFINKVAFLITISRNLRIGSITALDNRQHTHVRDCLLQVFRRYERRGFSIHTILADDEFESVVPLLPRYTFNLCGADEHVPDVERYIRTTKDTIRSTYNSLPFQCIPRIVLVRMAECAVFWQNAFPRDDSVTPDHSPRYLITGHHIDYTRHARIPFGAYAQTHEVHDNTMQPRTVSTICLGPTGNEQGTHFFLSLATHRVLRRPHFTELPMPVDVIQRVSDLGRQQGMPPTLTFANRHGHELHDDHLDAVDDDHDSDYSYSAANDDDSSFSSDAPSTSSIDSASTDGSHADPAGVDQPEPNMDIDEDDDTDADEDGDEYTYPEDTVNENVDHEHEHEHEINDDDTNDENEHEHSDDEVEITFEPEDNQYEQPLFDDIQQPLFGDNTGVAETADNTGVVDQTVENTGVSDENTGVAAQPRTLRSRQPGKKKDPVHLVGRGFEDKFMFLTAQMSAKKGLKLFGHHGANAITAELQQLHYRRVVRPIHGASLNREQKRACLHYLMFLKQKRCGKIKARGCADGRKQRLWKTKEETSSPTVRTESVYISATIDAMEHRHVATCDIPGAFMQADIDEIVHVKFEGEVALLLTQVDPDLYKKFLTTEHGKPVLYVVLEKALYGTVQAALLFWQELTQYLQDMGFALNPHDQCVANKTINGHQCTILWHVDDLKISHVEPQVVEDIIEKLNQRFGKEQELSVTRGDKHDYLGMTIDYSHPGEVQFTMFDYIDNMLAELPDDMSGTAATPAANYLFDVNPQAAKLDKPMSEFFHTQVAKLLYLCKRARPDIHTAVAFLTTRVTAPDMDDYGKLRRCMRYLRNTRELPLTLSAPPGPVHITWSVDASFAVHPDMKSHTGATLSLGHGVLYSMSTRQKLNTKSSTEAELVGVDDAMSAVIWTRNFIEAQGLIVADNVVLQDNQSAILLEKNGMKSSGKRTRHINIRYYFVQDRIENKELRIEYCPTNEMIADILTKPLQGSQFYKLRNRMLNVQSTYEKETSSTDPSYTTTSQECVGTSSPMKNVTKSNVTKSNEIENVITKKDDVAGNEWTVVKSRKKKKQKS
jgi:hypothetical protein